MYHSLHVTYFQERLAIFQAASHYSHTQPRHMGD